MRDFTRELAGQTVTLAATFRASVKVAEQVGDPLLIAREAALEDEMSRVGITYDPKWKFTVKNVPQIIHIGIETAGGKMSLADVQELVFEAGFVAARDLAASYLALIVTPDANLNGIDDAGESDEDAKK